MFKLLAPYNVCVIDVGSPKLGNLGWCYLNTHTGQEFTGFHLDDLLPHIAQGLQYSGLIIGLEAPLFVPLRHDLMLATKGRLGEGRRPWSAGAGAQVLALNLPIMVYLFAAIAMRCPSVLWHLDAQGFNGGVGQVMVFEALVSGVDKGLSHIDDARIMAKYCCTFAQAQALPPSILQPEEGVSYFNLAGAALLRAGAVIDAKVLAAITPIYKPSSAVL